MPPDQTPAPSAPDTARRDPARPSESASTVVDLTVEDGALLRVVPAVSGSASPSLPAPPSETPPRFLNRAIGPLGLIALVAWCASIGQLRTLAVVAALAFMILFHEAGHFFAARVTGMKATEFFLGFGPRLFSFTRGGTEFGVKALPLGGYVKVIGMTNLETIADPADESKTYRAATFPRKVLLASAGTIAHFVLAFVLLITLFSGLGRTTQVAEPIVGDVNPLKTGAAPAARAGLLAGDRIVAVNAKPVSRWDDVTPAIRSSSGRPLTITVQRGTDQKVVSVTPVRDADGTLRIGIGWNQNAVSISRQKVGLVTGAQKSVSYMARLVPETWGGLFRFFTPTSLKNYGTTLEKAATNKPLTQQESEGRMSSAVGITRLIGDASKDNIRTAIELFAVINIFVGMFNMLPLLPLDGGHVAVAIYERLRSVGGRRHRVDFRKLLPVTYVVLTVMALVGVTSLYLDITKPLRLF